MELIIKRSYSLRKSEFIFEHVEFKVLYNTKFGIS